MRTECTQIYDNKDNSCNRPATQNNKTKFRTTFQDTKCEADSLHFRTIRFQSMVLKTS